MFAYQHLLVELHLAVYVWQMLLLSDFQSWTYLWKWNQYKHYDFAYCEWRQISWLHVYLPASLGTTPFGLPCVAGEAAASFPELGLSVKKERNWNTKILHNVAGNCSTQMATWGTCLWYVNFNYRCQLLFSDSVVWKGGLGTRLNTLIQTDNYLHTERYKTEGKGVLHVQPPFSSSFFRMMYTLLDVPPLNFCNNCAASGTLLATFFKMLPLLPDLYRRILSGKKGKEENETVL